MSTFSIQTVRQAIENTIDPRSQSGLSALALLRELKELRQLSPAQAKRLAAIEKGLDEAAEKLFGYITEDSAIDSSKVEQRIRENLGKLDRATLGQILDAAYPKEEAARIKQQLAGSDEQKAAALDQITQRIIEGANDFRFLERVLDIWVTDPSKLHLAADFQGEKAKLLLLQGEASALFREEYRRVLAAQRPSLMNSFEESRPIASRATNEVAGVTSGGKTGTEDLKVDSGALIGQKAITEAGTAALLRTLEGRLETLNAEINEGRWALEKAPADKSYELGVKLRQTEGAAAEVRSEIVDLQGKRSAA